MSGDEGGGERDLAQGNRGEARKSSSIVAAKAGEEEGNLSVKPGYVRVRTVQGVRTCMRCVMNLAHMRLLLLLFHGAMWRGAF